MEPVILEIYILYLPTITFLAGLELAMFTPHMLWNADMQLRLKQGLTI
jgi:hypothetical protein